jgi:hypothetical protein
MSTEKHGRYELAGGRDVDLNREVVRDRQGRRITEAYVRRAVDATHRQLSRGRPSLTGHATPSPQVTFRLSPELRTEAAALAARDGRRVSEIAREALQEYLERRSAS